MAFLASSLEAPPLDLRRTNLLHALLYSLLILLVPRVHSQPQEYEVKAAFLYNFAQFCEWPSSAFASTNSPFVIGVLGDNPFNSTLDDLVRGEKVQQRPLEFRRFRSVSEIKECHILFISRSESSRVQSILNSLEGRPILTVSDIDRFAMRGGMIRFLTEQKKIKLRINISETRKAGLNISSKVLNLAEVVQNPKE
jgi:hypothetical protein